MALLTSVNYEIDFDPTYLSRVSSKPPLVQLLRLSNSTNCGRVGFEVRGPQGDRKGAIPLQLERSWKHFFP